MIGTRRAPSFLLAFAAAALLGPALAVRSQGRSPEGEAAKPAWAGVVVSLRGAATTARPGEAPAGLTGVDWVPEGAVVETRGGAELVLALRDGSRFRLGPSARAVVSAKGLSATSGPIETLSSVAPIPDVAPLVRPVPGQLGAVRIRSVLVRGLYPASPYTSLADSTTLSFEPPAPGAEVRVQVEDESGETVFETRTQAAALRLPPGILRPGERYLWRVRTIGRTGPHALGSAEFETLSPAVAAARERLAEAAGGDPAALTLAAEVDRQLGLLREAREGFAKVLALGPDGPRVAEIAAALEAEEKALLSGR